MIAYTLPDGSCCMIEDIPGEWKLAQTKLWRKSGDRIQRQKLESWAKTGKGQTMRQTKPYRKTMIKNQSGLENLEMTFRIVI